MSDQLLDFEQTQYIRRLARRYVRYRQSSSIDVDDLVSAASLRWWQFRNRNPELNDNRVIQICFYQQVKGAMRDVVRNSSPVKVTRTMQAQAAYQRPYTVDMDHVIDVQAGEANGDIDQWLDVVTSIKKLSEREQVILSLYFERDLSFTEIAHVYELSVSTITRIYRRAIDTVREDLSSSKTHAKNGPI